ncbi:MAG: ankyrin repeat domain-containing protein [bacterium]
MDLLAGIRNYTSTRQWLTWGMVLVVFTVITSPVSASKISEEGYAYNKGGFAHAVRSGKTDLVHQYLKAGMDPNVPIRKDAVYSPDGSSRFVDVKPGTTYVLHRAESPAVLEVLLKNGADPNLRSEPNRRTPLFKALQRRRQQNNVKKVSMLLEHGADPNVSDQYGNTPLLEAIEWLPGSPPKKPTLSKSMRRALPKKQREKMLVQRKKMYQRQKKRYEKTHKQVMEIVRLLLKNGADPNVPQVDKKYRSPDQLPLFVSIEKQAKTLTRTLLKKGADPSVRTKSGQTVKKWARENEHGWAVDVLSSRTD